LRICQVAGNEGATTTEGTEEERTQTAHVRVF